MKRRAIYGWLTAALLVCVVTAGRTEEETFGALLDRVLPGMGALEIPERSKPQQELQEAVWRLGAPDKEAELSEACRLMAGKLSPGTAKAARIWLMTQLMRDGGAESVAPLATSLGDKDAQIREGARRALMNNPAPAATTALLGALKKARGKDEKEAFCLSLAYRADPAAVPALAALLEDNAASITIAAARALGNIADAGSARALATALPSASGEPRRRIGDACLACADRLARDGKTAEAATVYRKLNAPSEPQAIRLAALQGQFATAEDGAVSLVARHLGSDDDFARNVAAGYIQDLPTGTDLTTLTAALPGLPEVGQVLALHAFAMRDDPVLLPTVLTAAKKGAEPVRMAAIQCLGTLGDGATVPVLADALFASDARSGAARRSLALLHGRGVDEALIALMLAEEEPARKGALIAVLQDRGSTAAAAALVRILDSGEKRMRGVALRAMGSVGRPEHVPAMIRAMLDTEGRERKDAAKSIVDVCQRPGKGRDPAAPILSAFEAASDADKPGILPLAGHLGGKKTLAVIKTSLKSDAAGLRTAAADAICNWPNDDALPVLETLATDAAHRPQAVQAYVRLAVENRRGDKEKLAMLRKAMELAAEDKERKLVLKRAIQVRRVESLRFVVPYLDRPELAGEAGRAIVYFAGRREITGRHKDEMKAALDKTLATAKDKWVQGQAKRLLGTL
jgi:HEAT repeat protein